MAARSRKKKFINDWTGTLLESQAPSPSRLDLIRNVVWSFSRRSEIERCPRRYYYQYYGSKQFLAGKDKQHPLLKKLDGLQNRYQRTGEILHQLIASYLRRLNTDDRWTEETLISLAKDRFNKDILYSQADPQGLNPPPTKFPPALLQEFYYSLPNALELCLESEGRLLTALKNFINSSEYQPFLTKNPQTEILIEKKISLKNFPCKVDGVVDCVFVETPILTVVDWKIGKSSVEGNESLQLATYTIWSCDEYGCEPENAVIFKATLGDGKVTPFSFDRRKLAAARARILQDAENVARMDYFGENAIAEAFTACGKPNICRLCPFLEACDEGRKCLSDEVSDEF